MLISPTDFKNQVAEIFIAQSYNDTQFENNGQITSVLLPGQNYQVGSAPANKSVVTLVDNDEPDGVSITQVVTEVNEGDNVIFQIKASSTASTDRRINLNIDDNGSDYIQDLIDHIVLPAHSKTVLLTLATQDNQINEADSDVLVTLESGDDYEVAPEFASATATIADNDQPIISIQAGETIKEGESVEFTITSSNESIFDLSIPISYVQQGDFTEISNVQDTVLLLAGEIEKIVELSTIDDDTHEIDGSISATLNSNSGYLINDAEYEAVVKVRDDDFPTISVTKVADVSEGDIAEFRVSADLEPQYDLTLNLISQWVGGVRIDNTINSHEVTLATGELSTLVAIRTIDNISTNEDFAYRINSSSRYWIPSQCECEASIG